MKKTAVPDAILEALTRKGWCFRNVEEINSLIQSMIPAKGNEMGSLGLIESELLNMDLRDIGGKSLPDHSLIKKSSHLQGPRVLQLVSVRDIHQSSNESTFGNSHSRKRLLRFCLTDGFKEIIALEYVHISSITEDLLPGIKMRLENKIAIRSGILCLDPQTVTILGGLVQSLYEEWQMSRKYSGFSRSDLKLSKSKDGVGPPPFEKLQIGVHAYYVPQHYSDARYSYSQTTSKVTATCQVDSRRDPDDGQLKRNLDHCIVDKGQKSNDQQANKDSDPETASLSGKIEDKPSTSESRPKEVTEAIPVQNQAAAQKLLKKMSQSSQERRPSRGPKYREKGKPEDPAVITLDEWERRKGGANPPVNDRFQNVARDEELARQLQNQLDLEDCQVKTSHKAEAEQIRMNMFSFGRAEENSRNEFGGRGKGRGRGRGRRRFG